MKKILKRKHLLLIFFLSIVFIFFTAYFLKEEKFDNRTKASEQGQLLWSISLIGDTQTHSEAFYNNLSDDIAKYNPRIMLHLGDFTFAKTADSLINKVIFRLRGDSLQIYQNPMEFHGVPGNHGDGYNNAHNDLGRNLICLGRLENNNSKFIFNGKENYGVPRLNEALNPDVQKVFSYCVPDGELDLENVQLTFPKDSKFNQQYSFERGGIRFILTGYSLSGAPEKTEWIKREICKPTSTSSTIILTHDAPIYCCGNYWNEMIDSLDCDHNIKLIVGGHVHKYGFDEYKGIKYLTVSGMFFGELGPNDPFWEEYNQEVTLSDHWVINVYSTKLDFLRYVWNGSKFDQGNLILSVPGNFTNYKYPTESALLEQQIELKKGLNLIVFNIDPQVKVSDIAKKIIEQEGDFKSIAFLKDGIWKSYKKTEQGFVGDDFEIDKNFGYIISMGNEIKFKYNGYEIDDIEEMIINTGWSLISTPNDKSASEYLEFLKEKDINAEMICKLENSKYVCLRYTSEKIYGVDFDLKYNNPYFLRVK